MTLRTTFAENLTFYRKQLRMSQQQLAEKCDIATNYLSEIERERKFPSVELIERLARELGIPAYLLFVPGEVTAQDMAVLAKKRNAEFAEKLLENVSGLLREYGFSE